MSNHIETLQLPGQVADALRKFLSARRTGNVTLNIKDGKILSAHVSEFVTASPADKPAIVNGAQRRPVCPN